ncbi:MAG TPA: o-succinylbenzoate synthase [Acidimicrobiia bacterium]|nr:o-succinylbenzoate synthase [Acidimicrobiia bacterium]
MRVERLTVREIELALRAPFATAHGIVAHRRLLLVELEDGDGTPGTAECVAGAVPGYTTETVDGAWGTITGRLAPRAVGLDVEDPSGIITAMGDVALTEPMARAALEMACWDLDARRENLPLAGLLGGTRSTVPAGIAIGLTGTPEETADAAAAAVGQGYQRIKLKIQPGADLEVVRAVRQRVGDGVALTVDGNGSYTRADLDHLTALDEFRLQMIEQPLPADDLAGHADLQRRLRTAVCLDESVITIANLERMISEEAGRVLNLKPGRVGGFTTALAMVDMAVAHGIDLWVGGMLETGVGRAHNVALASLEAFALPADLSPSDRYWEQDIVDPPWTMEAGALRVPLAEPGSGVSLDQARIQALTTRVREIRAAH